MTRPATLVLVFALVIAGCSGTSNGGPTAADTATSSVTEVERTPTPGEDTVGPPTPAKTYTPTKTPTPAETETPALVKNPWAEEPIIVAVDGPSDSPVNYTGAVRRAVEYWRENDHTDLEYRPTFVVKPSATTAHVVIRFVTSIENCGESTANETIGCAPILDDDDGAASPEIVRVQKGLTNRSTYRTVRHELGHVLGLEHREGPDDVMSPTDVVHDRVVRVNFVFETTANAEQRDTRRQARHAFEYYSDGAEGFMEEDVSFAIIQSQEDADVTISVERDGGRSSAEVRNGRMIITIQGIATDHRGWHIGYWLGFYFGAETVDELPPAFDDPNADSRQQWW